MDSKKVIHEIKDDQTVVTGTITRKEDGTCTFSGTFKIGNQYKSASDLTDADKDVLKKDFKSERDDLIKTYPGQFASLVPPGTGTLIARCDDDADGDLVTNAGDNCPNLFNPDQADENANGVGDACEIPLTYFLNLATNQTFFVQAFSLDPAAFDPAQLPFSGVSEMFPSPVPSAGEVFITSFDGFADVGSLSEVWFPPFDSGFLTLPETVDPQQLLLESVFELHVNGVPVPELQVFLAPLDTGDGFGLAALGTFGDPSLVDTTNPDQTLQLLGLHQGSNTVTLIIAVPDQPVAVSTVDFEITSDPVGTALICRVPRGNPALARTVSVAKSSLASHLARGDLLGPCASTSDEIGETLDRGRSAQRLDGETERGQGAEEGAPSRRGDHRPEEAP